MLSLYLQPKGDNQRSTPFKAGSAQPLSLRTTPKPPAHPEPVPACPFGTWYRRSWRLCLSQPPGKTRDPSLRQYACVLLRAVYSPCLVWCMHGRRGVYLIYSGKSQAFPRNFNAREIPLAQVQRRKCANRACSRCLDLFPLSSWPHTCFLLGRLER